jgi:hypothetical protein
MKFDVFRFKEIEALKKEIGVAFLRLSAFKFLCHSCLFFFIFVVFVFVIKIAMVTVKHEGNKEHSIYDDDL